MKLLDQVRHEIRLKHYSYKTEQAYTDWIYRYIVFNNKRHPAEMGAYEIQAFLTHLAVKKYVSASTQNQALNAIVFLYRHVLKTEPGDFSNITWAKKPKRLPVVFTSAEAQIVIAKLSGTHQLMAMLLYGSGLRLSECLQLRVKDIDFDSRQITVRSGKGNKDRVTLLPEKTIPLLKDQILFVNGLHRQDMKDGFTSVELPYALEKKYPNAGQELGWKFIFPATQISKDPRSGI